MMNAGMSIPAALASMPMPSFGNEPTLYPTLRVGPIPFYLQNFKMRCLILILLVVSILALAEGQVSENSSYYRIFVNNLYI
jgi:hypothetical protein